MKIYLDMDRFLRSLVIQFCATLLFLDCIFLVPTFGMFTALILGCGSGLLITLLIDRRA